MNRAPTNFFIAIGGLPQKKKTSKPDRASPATEIPNPKFQNPKLQTLGEEP
jgi:hypothetical protein